MMITAVITCMTDGERPFVAETVGSVLKQTVECPIIIIVAATNTWIEQILGDISARVAIKRVPLQPPGLVRNIGVQEAETEWIAFLDGDDIWLPEKIERQLAFAKTGAYSAIGARHILVRSNGAPFFYAFARAHPMTSSWIIKRELMLREPFSDVKNWEDTELWKRLKKLGVTSTMKDYLIHYRVRESSGSSNYSPSKRRKEFFARLSARNPTRWLIRSCSWVAAQVLTPPRA